MEFLDSNLPESSITSSRNSFLKAKGEGRLTENHQFSYALDLLRTSSKQHMKTAIFLLEDLFKSTRDDGFRRDCLFHLAIAHTKLPDYERALECCDNILKVQPQNHQTQQLKEEIHKRVRRDGITGIAAISGAVLGVAALTAIGLGIGLSKRK
uniref:Mitochondrial fission 1 protein n=1 Tax=Clonorchis sinensis TaxID=79923 RepID=F2VT58_CLOSI|nr:mitochondrial fission 1 protein [Clonorchis sinensis]